MIAKCEKCILDTITNVKTFIIRVKFQGSNSPLSYGEQVQRTVDCDYFGLRNVCKELFPLLRPHARYRVQRIEACIAICLVNSIFFV